MSERPAIWANEIFEFAESFRSATDYLNRRPGPRSSSHPTAAPIAPSAVMGAFTLELYLKCLLTIEGTQYPNKHDLKILYDLISPVNRQTIDTYAERYARGSPSHRKIRDQVGIADIAGVMDFSSDAFERFRYAFEHRLSDFGTSWGYCAFPVQEAIRQLILELNPDWNPQK